MHSNAVRHTILAALCAALVLPALACARLQRSPQPEATMLVATLNIWHDAQDWPARRELIIEGLRELDADIIGMQEILQKPGLRNQAEDIAEAIGYAVHFTSVDPPERPQRYGNAILARHPIIESNQRKLRPLDDYRNAAHARIAVGGLEVDVYNTHLHHTRNGGAIRAEQIADMLDFIESTRGGGPVLLLGDFNAAADWPELAPVHAQFIDTFALFVEDPLDGRHTTLNTALGLSARRIDFVFVERESAPVLAPAASWRFLDEQSPEGVWPSDHFGVATRFAVHSDIR